MKQGLLVFLVVSIFAVFEYGCVSGAGSKGSAPAIEVRLLPDGTVAVAGDVVPANRLPAKLRSAGAGPDTVIKVLLQPGQGQADFAGLVSVLQKAGYRKMVFVGQRQVKTSTR